MNTVNSDKALNFNAISDLFRRLSKHKAVIIEPLIVNFGIFTIGLVTVSMANESIGIPVGLREVVDLFLHIRKAGRQWQSQQPPA